MSYLGTWIKKALPKCRENFMRSLELIYEIILKCQETYRTLSELSDLFSSKILINYLQLLQISFGSIRKNFMINYKLNTLDELSKFLIMKDLFLPHWSRFVGEGMDENLPNQRISKGSLIMSIFNDLSGYQTWLHAIISCGDTLGTECPKKNWIPTSALVLISFYFVSCSSLSAQFQ